MSLAKEVLRVIRESQISSEEFYPLHAPIVSAPEKRFVSDCLNSGFVSSVGEHVIEFENELAKFIGNGAKVLAVTNGTAAIQLALATIDASSDNKCEFFCPSFSFVATAAAIVHHGLIPHFVDIGVDDLGVCPYRLENHIDKHCDFTKGGLLNRATGREIKGLVVTHVLGIPANMDALNHLAQKYHIPI